MIDCSVKDQTFKKEKKNEEEDKKKKKKLANAYTWHFSARWSQSKTVRSREPEMKHSLREHKLSDTTLETRVEAVLLKTQMCSVQAITWELKRKNANIIQETKPVMVTFEIPQILVVMQW